jgi:hypothetical protein
LATAALYGGILWGDWNYNCYIPVGEVLSGNMSIGYWGDAVQFNTFSVTSLNGIMSSDWRAMFDIVANCNLTIIAIKEKAPSSIPEKDKNAAIAEAKFLRAFAYYNLALKWGAVPIIEDNMKLISAPLINRNLTSDVYQFAVNDLTFAAKNLPTTDSQGRLTKWSAQGMLSKVYLTWAGLDHSDGMRNQAYLDSAKLYAGNVCKKSGLALMTNYADLFKTKNNDNPESLFALQWVPGGTWETGNMLQLYSAGGSAIGPKGQSGWFANAPTYDMYLQYSAKDSLRRKATFMYKGDYYPELNAAGGGFKFTGDAGLKKHIVGTEVDNNAPTMERTSSNEHNSLLRLADVYLIYAEAILGNNATTNNSDALLYFNNVRLRAGIDPVSVLNIDTIIHERRVELAAESHFWNDLIRLSYYNPSKAVNYLNKEQRINFSFNSDGTVKPGDPWGTVTPANIGTFTFPIPSSEITANPKLSEPPVPYSF